jgi:integrase
MADRTLFDGLSHTGGWELDVELDEVAIPDRSGRPFVIARVPRIERRFASPMHTVAGMAPRLGSWRDELAAFLAGGGTLGPLQQLLGHEDIATTARYLAAVDEQRAPAPKDPWAR